MQKREVGVIRGNNAEIAVEPMRERFLPLVTILLAGFMDLLDGAVLHVAIPKIQEDLDATNAQLAWIVIGYVLPFAVLLVAGGRLGDTYGRRRMLVIGTAGFTLASLLSGVATSPVGLIVARVLQGGMGALMVPQVLALLRSMFPGEQQRKAMSMFSAMVGLATVSGPVVGGLLTEGNIAGLSWRTIFLLNLPIGVLIVFVAARRVPDFRSQQRSHVDLSGILLLSTGLLLVVFPLLQARELGWPLWTFAALFAAVPVLGLFVRSQRLRTLRGKQPLVVLSLFRLRSFFGGMIAAVTLFGVMFSFFFTFSLYLQRGLGWSILHTGGTVVWWSAAIPFGSVLASRIRTRLERLMPLLGVVLLMLGLASMAVLIDTLPALPGAWPLVPGLVLAGLGTGVLTPAVLGTSLAEVPPGDIGSASGLINSAQQLGGVLGVALFGTIFFGLLGADSTVNGPSAVVYSAAFAVTLWSQIVALIVTGVAVLLFPREVEAPPADGQTMTTPQERT